MITFRGDEGGRKSMCRASGGFSVWFFDLSLGYLGVFTLCKFVELHTNDMYTSLYLYLNKKFT